LQREAKESDESLNTLINQILRFETEFAATARKIGTQAITRRTYRSLLEAMDDEEIARAGRTAGANTPKDFIESKYGHINLENVLNFLRVFSVYGRSWDYTETTHEDKTTIVLNHIMGRKYSLFTASYMASLFETIRLEPRISTSESSVIIELSGTRA